MPDKDQIYIFNNEELSLIKNTFAENEPLLYAIRKVFYQFELTESDIKLLKLVNPAVLNVLKKRILPDLSNVFPMGQFPTILSTLTTELKSKGVEEMAPHFESMALKVAYIRQQFAKLVDLSTPEPIQLNQLAELEGKSAEQRFIDMNAYLFLLGYIDPMLIMIKTIAGKKEETLEELTARLKRDSNK